MPGNTGKESYGRFPEEANYQCLGHPTDAEDNTAWHHQGRAAEDRDSNRRPEEDSMTSGVHFRPHASTSGPAEPIALVLGFRKNESGGHC